MFGFLNVNKPAGPTSHDVVAWIRRLLPRKTKVGHAGTLDPFASGVLVVCVGPATRLAEYVQRRAKRYTARITLGATSTTDDAQGDVQPTGCEIPCSGIDVQNVLPRFVGKVRQVPPAHSAVHVAGRRAYQLARAGQDVPLSPRTVAIQMIRLLRYDWPTLDIDVRCGGGTYIRALARDIGEALGVGGYCSSLTRTAVGPFVLETAVGLDDVDPARDLLPSTVGLDIPTIWLGEEQVAHLRHGRRVAVAFDALPAGATEVALLDKAGRLLAVAKTEGEGIVQPSKVFFPAE
ncbi:MAG: tRNA pseudouridine(55) synthase TruB [Phycisphaerae bacterium]|nr:tRNA pseudouridine(55) synthase TruB [Phycisphaerae bacterium]